jgi:hypothetical protein
LLYYATYNKAIKPWIKIDIDIWCWILGKVEEFYSCCLLHDKQPEATTLNISGTSVTNHQETANEFNKYFLCIARNINTEHNDLNFHKLDNTTPLHYLLQSFKTPFPNINLKFISSNEVENIIKSLKPKNSSGYDGISTKLLKISSSFISSPLTHICNKSISLGIFPDRMKYAVVKPLFKKGDRSSISNYRPISILSSFSKVI